ncbi:MAG: 3'-5' exonuclease [Limnohabitans sp.]
MIDLETMDTSPQAAIIAIGAVEFDFLTQEIGEKFYSVVDLASSVAIGGVIDADTVLWWMRQNDEARAAFDRKGEHINVALQQLTQWMGRCGDRQDVRVWGNGADFDNVILASAYRRSCLETPWEWRYNRCYRTVKKLHPHIVMQRSGAHHNALDDAVSQAVHLMEILATFPLPKTITPCAELA